MQSPDEKVSTVDWFHLLCIQTWCLWWFVDGTNVACLFDLRVCYVYILFDLRKKLKVTKSSQERKRQKEKVSFASELSLLRTIKIRNDELHK